ncbi:hypothetical protein E2C01_097457 [Portunus trituberculatus]|uniref:Uncharacterized protein n=1 Tax=Portunus trituberculatus TaxID=210409 RepID=A0A5B7K9M7_PORTR|nr:hypothetical protein [Portunus trituberculatus]
MRISLARLCIRRINLYRVQGANEGLARRSAPDSHAKPPSPRLCRHQTIVTITITTHHYPPPSPTITATTTFSIVHLKPRVP